MKLLLNIVPAVADKTVEHMMFGTAVVVDIVGNTVAVADIPARQPCTVGTAGTVDNTVDYWPHCCGMILLQSLTYRLMWAEAYQGQKHFMSHGWQNQRDWPPQSFFPFAATVLNHGIATKINRDPLFPLIILT